MVDRCKQAGWKQPKTSIHSASASLQTMTQNFQQQNTTRRLFPAFAHVSCNMLVRTCKITKGRDTRCREGLFQHAPSLFPTSVKICEDDFQLGDGDTCELLVSRYGTRPVAQHWQRCFTKSSPKPGSSCTTFAATFHQVVHRPRLQTRQGIYRHHVPRSAADILLCMEMISYRWVAARTLSG